MAGGGGDHWADVAWTNQAEMEQPVEAFRVRRRRGRGTAEGAWPPTSDKPCLFLCPGTSGSGVPEPGEEPSGPGSIAGLRGSGPLPARGQPVAGLLLVLPHPAGHVGRRRHSDLHAEASLP